VQQESVSRPFQNHRGAQDVVGRISEMSPVRKGFATIIFRRAAYLASATSGEHFPSVK
jgi:hypothetical protein